MNLKIKSILNYYCFYLTLHKKKLLVLTSWSGHNELIEGEAFSTGFDDSCSGGLGESESGNGHLWYIKKSIVISDSANNNGDFISKQ